MCNRASSGFFVFHAALASLIGREKSFKRERQADPDLYLWNACCDGVRKRNKPEEDPELSRMLGAFGGGEALNTPDPELINNFVRKA